MKYTLFALTIILILAFTACSTTSTTDGRIPATMDRVVDGDTLRITMDDGTEETVRLLMVDTPETVHPNEPVQPFGPEAGSFVKQNLAEGSSIEVEVDTTTRDRYDRFLAYIWQDGEMINEQLLEEGLARVAYVYEPNTRYEEEFREIEQEAQEAGRGIWSIDGYVSDDGFRPNTASHQAPSFQIDCEDPAVKGNHSSSGERIYHVPGGQHYEQTKEEELFCTPEQAEQAGYRASQR